MVFAKVLQEMISADISNASFRILTFLLSWNGKKSISLSYGQIMKGTNIKNRSTISKSIKELEGKSIIKVNRSDHKISIYKINNTEKLPSSLNVYPSLFEDKNLFFTNFYMTREWVLLRNYIRSIFKNKCMKCGHKKKLHVDHIKPKSKNPYLALSPANMQVLCADCNLEKSNIHSSDSRKKKDKKRAIQEGASGHLSEELVQIKKNNLKWGQFFFENEAFFHKNKFLSYPTRVSKPKIKKVNVTKPKNIKPRAILIKKGATRNLTTKSI